MKRTEDRLPKQRMTTNQALSLSLSMGLIGVFFLFSINFYSGFLARFQFFVLAYTPLKRISPFSVFVDFPWRYSFYARMGSSN